MAGKKKSELEVWEQLKDITECCVCSKTYKDPKMLPCIHTFCRTCLEEIGCRTSKSPGNQIPCPICRKEFTIPEEGYAALQRNFFMEKLIEMAQIASLSEGPDLCEACMEEESKSTSASEVPLPDINCAECPNKLCEKCSRYHIKNKLTRNHQVVGGAGIKCKVQNVAPSSCMKHEMELDLYCSDCKKLLCKSCFGESHQSHRLKDIRNVVEGFKNEIKDSLSSLEVCESKVLERKVILNCEVEKYCENMESLKLEVLAQTDAVIKLVSEQANRIMQDVDQLKVQKQNDVQAETADIDQHLTCLESFKDYGAEVMTKGSDSDICCAIDKLKATAEEIKEQLESETEINTQFRKMSFLMSDIEEYVKTEDYNIIGTIREVPPARICIDYKGSLVNTQRSLDGDLSYNGEYNEYIFGFTVMDDELFLGCVIGHYVVRVYDIETFNFKRRWDVKSQSNMDYINCIVSCARDKHLDACVIMGGFDGCLVIHRADVDGSNAKEWKIKANGPTFVSDLSVTGEGNIIVMCDSLFEYSRDGILVHEVKLPLSLCIVHPSHALKLANGNFVVSHGHGTDPLHRVLLLSESGQITKSLGERPASDVRLSLVKPVPQVYEPKLWNVPTYLTVDGFGNILVADWGNNRIVVLNSNLEFNGFVNTTQPLRKPSCLCFDSNRKQLFVCEDQKKISVYDFSDSVIRF